MRQLVQQQLPRQDCLALLRTSHALGRAAVQHRTHPQPPQRARALHWKWWPTKPEGATIDLDANSVDVTPEAATAASLLVRWAPAELRVALHGTTWRKALKRQGTAISLPAALLPLITHLHLQEMHLTPATLDLLQRCQRLHTLDVDKCTFGVGGGPSAPPARTLEPLPLLRTFRCARVCVCVCATCMTGRCVCVLVVGGRSPTTGRRKQ